MNNSIIYITTQRYIYFDATGNILSVSNNNNTLGNNIKVEFNQVESLISGKEHFHHYRVIFDTITNTYVLFNVCNEGNLIFSIDLAIHKISQTLTKIPDLIITQDTVTRVWKFELNKAIRENFQTLNVEPLLTFSISKYNDLHQLEQFISLPIEKLISDCVVTVPYESSIPVGLTKMSIYTTKRLNTYYHKVLL